MMQAEVAKTVSEATTLFHIAFSHLGTTGLWTVSVSEMDQQNELSPSGSCVVAIPSIEDF